MQRTTLNVGLQSERENWFNSSSVIDETSSESLTNVATWTFNEGCRRLCSGGWNPPRNLSLSVVTHAGVNRLQDDNRDLITHYHPDDARLLMEHLFAESMQLLYRRQDDGRGTPHNS